MTQPRPSIPCSDGQFQCKDTTIRQCINKKWVCDGHADCYDDSDEPASCSMYHISYMVDIE